LLRKKGRMGVIFSGGGGKVGGKRRIWRGRKGIGE